MKVTLVMDGDGGHDKDDASAVVLQLMITALVLMAC